MSVMQAFIKSSGKSLISHVSPSLSVSCVRYRKPRDVPKAPSKMYYVREPTKRDPVEQEILKEEYNTYRTTIKSLHAKLKMIGSLSYIKNKKGSSENGSDMENSLQHGLELNRIWNEEIAVTRKARLDREENVKLQMTDQKVQENLSKMQRSQVEGQEALSKMSKVYLTDLSEEELDTEIDTLLDSPPVNHDFAASAVSKPRINVVEHN